MPRNFLQHVVLQYYPFPTSHKIHILIAKSKLFPTTTTIATPPPATFRSITLQAIYSSKEALLFIIQAYSYDNRYAIYREYNFRPLYDTSQRKAGRYYPLPYPLLYCSIIPCLIEYQYCTTTIPIPRLYQGLGIFYLNTIATTTSLYDVAIVLPFTIT